MFSPGNTPYKKNACNLASCKPKLALDVTYLSHLLYMNYLQDLAGQILIKLQFLASCNCKWANLKPWVCNEVVGNPHFKKYIAKLSRSFHLTCVWKILKRWWPNYPNTTCHLARTKRSSLNCQVVLNMGKKFALTSRHLFRECVVKYDLSQYFMFSPGNTPYKKKKNPCNLASCKPKWALDVTYLICYTWITCRN